jgi:hypothetical protein
VCERIHNPATDPPTLSCVGCGEEFHYLCLGLDHRAIHRERFQCTSCQKKYLHPPNNNNEKGKPEANATKKVRFSSVSPEKVQRQHRFRSVSPQKHEPFSDNSEEGCLSRSKVDDNDKRKWKSVIVDSVLQALQESHIGPQHATVNRPESRSSSCSEVPQGEKGPSRNTGESSGFKRKNEVSSSSSSRSQRSSSSGLWDIEAVTEKGGGSSSDEDEAGYPDKPKTAFSKGARQR